MPETLDLLETDSNGVFKSLKVSNVITLKSGRRYTIYSCVFASSGSKPETSARFSLFSKRKTDYIGPSVTEKESGTWSNASKIWAVIVQVKHHIWRFWSKTAVAP